MAEQRKKFKSPPKRFQPRGLTILYEDHDVLVADKASGLLTIGTDKVTENTAYSLLNQYVRKGNPKSHRQVYVVHRLDRDISGVIVFAKTEKAKGFLLNQWQEFPKQYIAVVLGKPPEKEGVLTAYLAENKAHKMYAVKDPSKGKLAKTGYKLLKETANHSLLELKLLTACKNQLRAHCSEAGFPVAGDKIYGERDKSVERLTLHSASVTIKHPHSQEEMTFESKTPKYFTTVLSGDAAKLYNNLQAKRRKN